MSFEKVTEVQGQVKKGMTQQRERLVNKMLSVVEERGKVLLTVEEHKTLAQSMTREQLALFYQKKGLEEVMLDIDTFEEIILKFIELACKNKDSIKRDKLDSLSLIVTEKLSTIIAENRSKIEEENRRKIEEENRRKIATEQHSKIATEKHLEPQENQTSIKRFENFIKERNINEHFTKTELNRVEGLQNCVDDLSDVVSDNLALSELLQDFRYIRVLAMHAGKELAISEEVERQKHEDSKIIETKQIGSTLQMFRAAIV